jgi:hypothetical protein
MLTWLWLPILTCLGVLFFSIVALFVGTGPFMGVWDDGYMFVRYADNLRAFHTVAWNPGGEPTYGLTAPLFLGVVVPVRMLMPGNPTTAALLSSLICGLVFLALLLLLVYRATNASPLVKRSILLLTLASLAFASSHLDHHLVSGMDTMFVLAFLTLLVWLGMRQEQALSPARAVALGLCGGIAYLVRPDLLIYTSIVPCAQVAFSPSARARRLWLVALLLTLLIVILELVCTALYFHSAFPLPFYAKSMGLYADFNPSRYRHTPFRELLDFFLSYKFLIVMIGADLVWNRRTWRQESSPLEKGLLAATVLFILYYLLFVLQIMGREQRFYYPTLPALAFLAAHSTARLARRAQEIAPRVPAWPRLYGLGLVLLIWAAVLPPRMSDDYDLLLKFGHGQMAHFNIWDEYRFGGRSLWFHLDDFSALPDDLVIATTEIGRLSAMNPHKAIIDLAGLNDTELARSRFSAEHLFAHARPDLIYMPHPDYRGMQRELTGSPIFIKEYVYYPAETLGPYLMGVALRRDSRYFPAMQRIVAEGRNSPPPAAEDSGAAR